MVYSNLDPILTLQELGFTCVDIENSPSKFIFASYKEIPNIPIIVDLSEFGAYKFSFHAIYEEILFSEEQEDEIIWFLNAFNNRIKIGAFALFNGKINYVHGGKVTAMEEPELYLKNILEPVLQLPPILYPFFKTLKTQLPLSEKQAEKLLKKMEASLLACQYSLPKLEIEDNKELSLKKLKEGEADELKKLILRAWKIGQKM